MGSILPRIKASLLLAPAVLLLLVFMARCFAAENLSAGEIWSLLGWAAGCSLVISYLITLYLTFLVETLKK